MLRKNTKKLIIICSLVFIIILAFFTISNKIYATDVDLSNEVSIPVTAITPEIDISNETPLLPVIIPIEEENNTSKSNKTETLTNNDVKSEIDNNQNKDIENSNVIDSKDSIITSNITNEIEPDTEKNHINSKLVVAIIIIIVVAVSITCKAYIF